MSRASTLITCLVSLSAAAGCTRSPFEVAPVHGVVTVDDKPLFQGKVMLPPVAKTETANPGKPSLGTIESNGAYRLTTFSKDDGAVVGEHWVTIINSAEQLPDGVPKFARFMMPEKVTVAPAKDN